MAETIFGKIARGEIPCDKVYEDDRSLAFRDINPHAPTHILIIPKEEIEDVSQVSEGSDILGHLFAVANKIAAAERIAESGSSPCKANTMKKTVVSKAGFLLLAVTVGFSADTVSNRPVQDTARWERPETDLLWGFGNMYQPCVLEFSGGEYRFRMWFFGWAKEDCNPGYPGCDAIFFARSKDLVKWEVYCGDAGWDPTMASEKWVPVLTAGGKQYEAWHVGDPSVVFKDGVYHMAYSATSLPGYRNMKDHLGGMMLCIMGATSRDGISWKKTEEPLLIEPPEVRHATSDENWIGDYHRPCLRWDRGKWRLWFDYWATRKQGVCMGLAENAGDFESPEGFEIVHAGTQPLIVNWPNPEVVRIGNRYHSFADPNGYPPKVGDPNEGWTSRQICEAVSDDGIAWEVVGFLEPDSDTPACHVPQTLTTALDGKKYLYLFYATQRGGDPVYDYRYDRIRAWRREIRD